MPITAVVAAYNEEKTIAAVLRALTSSPSEIVFVPYDEAYEAGFEDMQRRVPDLTKIHNLIGYKPTVSLDEILARVIASCREELALDSAAS